MGDGHAAGGRGVGEHDVAERSEGKECVGDGGVEPHTPVHKRTRAQQPDKQRHERPNELVPAVCDEIHQRRLALYVQEVTPEADKHDLGTVYPKRSGRCDTEHLRVEALLEPVDHGHEQDVRDKRHA